MFVVSFLILCDIDTYRLANHPWSVLRQWFYMMFHHQHNFGTCLRVPLIPTSNHNQPAKMSEENIWWIISIVYYKLSTLLYNRKCSWNSLDNVHRRKRRCFHRCTVFHRWLWPCVCNRIVRLVACSSIHKDLEPSDKAPIRIGCLQMASHQSLNTADGENLALILGNPVNRLEFITITNWSGNFTVLFIAMLKSKPVVYIPACCKRRTFCLRPSIVEIHCYCKQINHMSWIPAKKNNWYQFLLAI